MRQINTEELKKIQLEILDVVMKFCDEHDIHCFLEAGTLLGAVRHKGYIPWDDDIDIAMLRPDYDRFIKLFNQENTRYKVDCIENDPESLYFYGKIYDTSTELYEPNKKIGKKKSINIDIWVMDNAPDDDKELRKMFIRQYIYRQFNAGRWMPMFTPPNGNILRKIIAYAVRITLNMIPEFILPRNYFGYKLLKNSRRYVYEETKRVGNFLGAYSCAMEKEKFRNFIYAEFEGRRFKIPSGYDEWLTQLYGDYMTPPPENKRASRHHFEAFVND